MAASTEFKIRNIEFNGNKFFSTDQLLSEIRIKEKDVLNDSLLENSVQRIIRLYNIHAYLHVKIDSVVTDYDSLNKYVNIFFFLNENKPSILRRIHIAGNNKFSIENLVEVMQLAVGKPFIPAVLNKDIETLLEYYDQNGLPLVKIMVGDISFIDSIDEISVSLEIKIDEGKQVRISEVNVEGNKYTRDYVVIREVRLHRNAIYQTDLLKRIKYRLDRLQLFSQVSLPELYITEKDEGGLLIKVLEANHNNFDGMIGYIPRDNSKFGGYVTGLVKLSFRNLFGTGRKLSVRWYQENKYSRETEISYLEPWILSYPINMQVGLFQRKQDSTFVKNQYDLSLNLMLTEEFSIGASLSFNNVYPSADYGKTILAPSRTNHLGASILYDSRDNVIAPTGGILYYTEYQLGTKQIDQTEIFPSQKLSAKKLKFDFSYYSSLFNRQVLAVSLFMRDLQSDKYDFSDLSLLGGANTLRGYREGQFLGSRLIWTNIEYRLLVDMRSFFYIFTDIGYIRQPEILSMGLSNMEIKKIGYGIGMQLDSVLGLIGVSFAFGEGDTFSTSKIHFRLVNEF